MTISKTVTQMFTWDVQGSFILPGTRDKLSFGPHRVIGPNRTVASAGLVSLLNEQFAKELQNMPRVAFQNNGFSKGFAQMHLNWTAVGKALPEMAVIPQEDRNDPPALNI